MENDEEMMRILQEEVQKQVEVQNSMPKKICWRTIFKTNQFLEFSNGLFRNNQSK